MKELKAEMVKIKNSNSLYISILFPLSLIIYTIFSRAATRNTNGLINGHSIIQISIFNNWTLLLIHLLIILIISSDFKNENKNNNFQYAVANGWKLNNIYIAKLFKYTMLTLLSYITLFAVIIVSNKITTNDFGNIKLIISTIMYIWFCSLSLIPINMLLIKKIKTTFSYILNVLIIIFFVYNSMANTKFSLFFPWMYGLNIERLALNIKANGLIGIKLPISMVSNQLEIMLGMTLIYIAVEIIIMKVLIKWKE